MKQDEYNPQTIIKVGHAKRSDGIKCVLISFEMPDGTISATFQMSAANARVVADGLHAAAKVAGSALVLPGEGPHFKVGQS